jgi:feruloyl esterase
MIAGTVHKLRRFQAILVSAAATVSLQAASRCADLASLTIPNVTLTATEILAGPFSPGGGPNSSAMPLPGFCRVKAVANPVADSEIKFEVWIPSVDWNGKFQGVGNSGWSGTIAYASMAAALRRGYATASTDAGHTGDDLTFGLHPAKVDDWAWRAVHVMTESAKVVVRASEGRFPKYSYFTGCSTGGAQGLTETQRFPGDYDGVLASDPGNERINRVASYLWSWAAAHKDPASVIPAVKLDLMTRAAVQACDRLDGVEDGVIGDPRGCQFDPAMLLCKRANDDKCLTAPQVEAAKKIYEGPRNPRTGAQIFPGEPPGSEYFGDGGNAGWSGYIMDAAAPPRLDFWRYFVFNDPDWDWRTFDWDRDLEYAHRKMNDIDATDPRLHAFRKNGGKIVMYLGWDDPIHVSQSTLNYFQAVEREMGGVEKTGEFFRTFLVPGLGHCSGGPGTTTVNALPALEEWVEHDVPPDKIVASRVVNGVVERTRPLCPHPRVAIWNGKGNANDASNFSCVKKE